MAWDLPGRMKAARRDRGMTQAQLAELLHVKQASVSMIEEKELVPAHDLVLRIRAWLDSGKGARSRPPRGPYKFAQKKRKTTGQGNGW